MNIVYHGSDNGGLLWIEPKVSSHGKAYVYATKNKALTLVFTQRTNDYLLNISNVDGLLTLTERIPGVFEETYFGKTGYIYQLNGMNFMEGKTSFDMEVVSEHAEKVLCCEEVTDIGKVLSEMEIKGELMLYRYPMRPEHMPKDNNDLVESTRYFIMHGANVDDIIAYSSEKHPELKEKLYALKEELINIKTT